MDVLKIIADMKARLWREYGDVLSKPFSQDETHLTYYASDLLNRNGFTHSVFDGETYYTEKALQRAFVAGVRIGKKEADALATQIVNERMSQAISALNGDL